MTTPAKPSKIPPPRVLYRPNSDQLEIPRTEAERRRDFKAVGALTRQQRFALLFGTALAAAAMPPGTDTPRKPSDA